MATDKPRYTVSVDDEMFAKIEAYKHKRSIARSEATAELIQIGLEAILDDLAIKAETVPIIPIPANPLMLKKIQLFARKKQITLEQAALYLIELGYMALTEKRKGVYSRAEILLASHFEELSYDAKIRVMQILNDSKPKLIVHPGDVEYAYSNIEDVGALIAAYSVASPEAQNQVREILGIPHEIDAHEDAINSTIDQTAGTAEDSQSYGD